MKRLGLSTLALLSVFGSAVSVGTAFVSAEAFGRSRTPPMLKRNHDGEKIAYRLTIRPGTTEPGQTMVVELALAEILARPDPTFGTRKPIDDAQMVVTLVGAPAKGKKKKKGGAFVDARQAYKLSDAGTYAVTFTTPTEGLYGLHLSGDGGSGGAIDWSTTVSCGVWPIPNDATPVPLPSEVPEATVGNLTNGAVQCNKHCKKDIVSAQPKGKSPRFLGSDFGAGQTDEQLLASVVGDAVTSLSPTDKIDLLFYLHSLHVDVREFFPEAGAYLVGDFTIDKHGIERLEDSGRIKLGENDKSARVFVVYKGEAKNASPAMISMTDRIARDQLNKGDRLGYVIFFEMKGERKAKELAVALGRETDYSIVGLIARDANNARDSGVNKALASFAGQGKFNDPKSLKKGSKSWQKKLLPVYLRAAELATMYYKEEREFTAFDDEFN